MSDHAISPKEGLSSGGQVTSRADIIRMEVYGGLLALFSVAMLLALVTFDRADVGRGVTAAGSCRNLLGPVGAHMADLFLWLLGLVSYLLTLGLGYLGLRAVFRRPISLTAGPVSWSVTLLATSAVLLEIAFHGHRPFGYPPSGVIGLYAGQVMVALFSVPGTAILAGAALAISITYLAGSSLGALLRFVWRGIVFVAVAVGSAFRRLGLAVAARTATMFRRREPVAAEEAVPAMPEPVHDTVVETPRWADRHEASTVPGAAAETVPPVPEEAIAEVTAHSCVEELVEEPMVSMEIPPIAVPEAAARPFDEPKIVVNPRRPSPIQDRLPLQVSRPDRYEPPPLSLLDFVEVQNNPLDKELLHRNAEVLERKLLDYKVEGKVVEIHPGPVVTMYEFLPAPGVKISQIANLADDLTMALEAVSIRIVAPIPGKGVVGIEVPNAVRETVYLREILASEEFTRSRSKLTLALGKDIFGNPMVTDLSKMPHLLIAGATGSGKSVAVNAFILSLLCNATPDEVRIILVDPKVVELQVYEGVPHLLLPVVYDPKHAAAALRWAVEEMERRYELLARVGTRNLQGFNQRIDRIQAGLPVQDGMDEPDLGGRTEIADPDGEEMKKLPFIVIILDEFADLMMVASKEVETAVTRLAQKARAAGIHLIMATQRPSKEVITGLIKSNFPSRVAFRVSSKIDSRIILDQSGADALLGYGDMLFLRPGNSIVTRAHGPFVSEGEVHRVVAHLKRQGTPDYDMAILQTATEAQDEDPGEQDALLEEAIQIVLESRRASISYIQRRLKVGYNRSARIMEQMERKGIVGPPDSRGERQVLM